MELTTLWFVLIAVLWIGYLVLEGFDFGVGMLMALLAQNDRERRVLLNTIGPVWDANEVWLLVAGGATFAAFPEWYATLFSGFYLPLLLILLALIVRVVGIEFRSKRPDPGWKRWCDIAIITGSFVPAVLWGVALANIVRGVPIDAAGEYAGSFWDLLGPYALLGGLVTMTVFLVHGAFFVALKTTGPIRERALSFGLRVGVVAGALVTAFVVWTVSRDVSAMTLLLAAGVLVAYVFAGANGMAHRDGWAFAGTAVAIGLLTVLLFASLFPDVMPSSLDPAWSLTTENASATPYTLKIMSWVALVFTPLVLMYQGWSYWVFRRRIGVHHIPA